jgi:uncharacterized protein YrrD
MDYKEDAVIYSADGEEMGRLDRVVLDPASGGVSHIVLRRGWFFTEDRVVPVEFIDSASEKEIRLSREIKDLEQLSIFEEAHFIEPGLDTGQEGRDAQYAAAPSIYWYPPVSVSLGYPGFYNMPYVVKTERNIPEGAIPLKDGSNVLDLEGKSVGSIERVITSSGDQVTHFVVSSGLLSVTRKLIPSHWVSEVKEDEVRLGVPEAILDRLPEFKE